MSALTPPVAVAAYAASAIANANPLEIAVNAVKISVGAFIVPFAFLFNNALLLDGKPAEIVFSHSCLPVWHRLSGNRCRSLYHPPTEAMGGVDSGGIGLLMLVPVWQIVVCAAGVASLIIIYEIVGSRPKTAR